MQHYLGTGVEVSSTLSITPAHTRNELGKNTNECQERSFSRQVLLINLSFIPWQEEEEEEESFTHLALKCVGLLVLGVGLVSYFGMQSFRPWNGRLPWTTHPRIRKHWYCHNRGSASHQGLACGPESEVYAFCPVNSSQANKLRTTLPWVLFQTVEGRIILNVNCPTQWTVSGYNIYESQNIWSVG